MAPKRPSSLEDPPSASSSDDEEVAADEEVEEEEEEEAEEEEEEEEAVEEEDEVEAAAEEEEEEEVVDEEEALKSPAVPMASSQPVVKKPAAEDVPNLHKKASKPVEDAEMKKANSKSVKAPYLKSIVKAGAKRESEEKEVVVPAAEAEAAVKDGKKRKNSETEVTEREEKQPLDDLKKQGQGQGLRLFSEESAVELLKGIAAFVDKTGKVFKVDQDGFYEYVKKELDVDFSKAQLMTKVKNLKRKYKKNIEKVKNGDELKPLEQKLYELSSKIWGGGGLVVKSASNGLIDVASKSNGPRKRAKKEIIVKNEDKEMRDAVIKEAEVDSLSLIEVLKSNAGSVLNEELIKRGWNLVAKDKRMKMNEQWESLLLDEVKLNLRRLELARLQGQLVLDAFGASSH